MSFQNYNKGGYSPFFDDDEPPPSSQPRSFGRANSGYNTLGISSSVDSRGGFHRPGLLEDFRSELLKPKPNPPPTRNWGLPSPTENDLRTPLLGTQSRLDRDQEVLAQARRDAADVEIMGGEVVDNLSDQTRQLEEARQNLHDVNEKMGTSKKILRDMVIRMWKHRICCCFFWLIVFAIVGVVLWYNFGPDAPKPHPTPSPSHMNMTTPLKINSTIS